MWRSSIVDKRYSCRGVKSSAAPRRGIIAANGRRTATRFGNPAPLTRPADVLALGESRRATHSSLARRRIPLRDELAVGLA